MIAPTPRNWCMGMTYNMSTNVARCEVLLLQYCIHEILTNALYTWAEWETSYYRWNVALTILDIFITFIIHGHIHISVSRQFLPVLLDAKNVLLFWLSYNPACWCLIIIDLLMVICIFACTKRKYTLGEGPRRRVLKIQGGQIDPRRFTIPLWSWSKVGQVPLMQSVNSG